MAAFAALLMLSSCAAVPPPPPQKAQKTAEAPLECGKLDDILLKLEKNAAYAYTADAIDSHGRVHEWFINPKSRAWAQIHVYSNLRACIEARGYDWHWAVETSPKK